MGKSRTALTRDLTQEETDATQYSFGFPLFTHCPRAKVTDDQGLIERLSQNMDYFRYKSVEMAKTTILLDHGYHRDTIQQALELICAG